MYISIYKNTWEQIIAGLKMEAKGVGSNGSSFLMLDASGTANVIEQEEQLLLDENYGFQLTQWPEAAHTGLLNIAAKLKERSNQ